jgi:hypothetical protein
LASERHRRVVTGEEVSDTDLLVLSRTRPEMLGVVYERHAPAVFRSPKCVDVESAHSIRTVEVPPWMCA